jgi:O-succinylbenzoic acid--CoA ligase
MTETITHIAAKSRREGFSILPNIVISQMKKKMFSYRCTKITEEQIVTNDLVELMIINLFF